MITRTWAHEFDDGSLVEPATGQHVDLHVADTAVAFFAGHSSPEARALAKFFAGTGAGPDAQSAAIAAMIRRTECDDIHVASCITPGSVVIPVALTFSAHNDDPAQFDRAVTAGYAVGLRIGSTLGGAAALGTGIWPTYFAAPMMATATAAVSLGLDAEQIAAAISLAAAGAGGRLGRIGGYPSGRWLMLGEAVGKGCRAAMAAAKGFQGDPGLISPDWRASIGDPKFIRPDALMGGDRIEAVGLKPFVAARQVINAVAAFQAILERGIDARDIERIEIRVPPLHAAMVERAAIRGERLSTIANMHVRIAAAALKPDLLYDIERDNQPADDLTAYGERISIIPDVALDAYLPGIWAARVAVLAAGVKLEETCVSVPGDPGRDDARAVVEAKINRMVPPSYRDICTPLADLATTGSRAAWHVDLRQAMLGILAEI